MCSMKSLHSHDDGRGGVESLVVPQFPELAFEEADHIYRLNGVEIPSVTTLMKPLSNAFYKDIDPGILERAAQRGTAVHNACENFALYGIEDICPAYAGYFAGFLRWWEENDPVVYATETRFYHKIMRYAGTADLICGIGGERVMIDYKTSAQVNNKLCAIQMEGYDRALESHGVKIDRRIILHLGKNGTAKPVEFRRDAKNWSVFSSLLTIHNYMNESR